MTSIIPFKACKDLEAAVNLSAFIDWAKTTLPQGGKVKAGIQWNADSWTRWNIPGSRVSSLEAGSYDKGRLMAQPFRDFAKAVMVQRAVKDGKGVEAWMWALKGLEAALFEITGAVDVTRTNEAVCAKACCLMLACWPNGQRAYQAGMSLAQIVALLRNKHMLSNPFRWTCPIACQKIPSLKQQEADGGKKLPSDESLVALGEIFHAQPTSLLDIMVSSSAALLLCAPSRISELAYVTHNVDHVEIDTATGEAQLYLRWYGVKGFGDKPVPVIDQMRATCEEAIRRVRKLTHEGRSYAKWLEEHPDEFPAHSKLPNKNQDASLTIEEACDALMLSYGPKSPRSTLKQVLKKLNNREHLSPRALEIASELYNGFEAGNGRGIWENGKKVRVEFNDTCVLTLRKLNVLMREKYLPRTFPYTDEKQIIKYSEALFTVRTGTLTDDTKTSLAVLNPLGVTLGCEKLRLICQLTGSNAGTRSIFERWHYPGVSVNSHAFRHYLNTAGQRAGLSDVLIAAWSGRVDVSQNRVYNHETVEERTQAVAKFRDYDAQANRQLLAKVRTNQPLQANDLIDLKSDPDRILHQGAFGVCVHDFSESPCQKMGGCLTCGKLACIKGDDVKLNNLKVELARLEDRLKRAKAAEDRGDFGAQEWVKQANEDLVKCRGLIAVLENPDLDDGSVVWNQDNGWTVTTNALAMKGLLDQEEGSVPRDAGQSLRLADLKALMGR